MTTAVVARESARQADGKFGTQPAADVSGDVDLYVPAVSPGSHLRDVGPTDDTYWGEGGCGAMAIAFVHLVPGLKIGVEWGTGHDEGLVWHAAAYDPATGRSFDFNGTDSIDGVLGNFSGNVEMDVDPARVADAMSGLSWDPDNPWESDSVHEAAGVIDEHWGLFDDSEQDNETPHTQVA